MLRTVLLAGLLAAACGCVCATGRILDGGGNDAIQIDAPDAPDVALDRVPDGADAPEGEADVPSDSDAADADGGCTTGYACGASCVLDCTSCPGAPLRCAEQCVPSCAGCASGDVNCANVCAADCAACAGAPVLCGGVCQASCGCSGGMTDCMGRCVSCPVGGVCTGVGTCDCPAGTHLCSGACVSATDPAFGCGGASCAACSVSHGAPTCTGGVCAVGSCDVGWSDCNGAASDGCEASLGSTTDCGACGHACANAHGTTSCSSGACVPSCSLGWASCDGSADNGCEQSLATDTNCGACGTPCSLANATASCATGSCSLSACNAGWGNCNGTASDGCETALNTSTNCGSCGAGCSLANATSSCGTGSCAIASCNPAYSNCDGVGGNGCERLINDNYGSCGINNLGSISGDAGAGTLSFSSWGENWVSFTLTEDSSSSVYMSAQLVLTVPPDVDYDLYVHCGGSCGSAGPAGTALTGVTEVVDVRWEDRFALSDTRTVYAEVRWYGGGTLGCGDWTLTVYGNTAVATATCP